MRDIESRRIRVVEIETQTPSAFARSLLFGYVASFVYEGDSPLAERKAAALALDPALLGELLGRTELRDLLDPSVVDEIERQLQRLAEDRQARSAEGVADLLRAARAADRRDEIVERSHRARLPSTTGSTTWRQPGVRSGSGSAAGDTSPRSRTSRDCAMPSACPCPPACPMRSPSRLPTRSATSSPASPARTDPSPPPESPALRARPGGRARRVEATGRGPAGWPRASSGPAASGASGVTPRCCGGSVAARWPRPARRSSRSSRPRWGASCRPGRTSAADCAASRACCRSSSSSPGCAVPASALEPFVLAQPPGRLPAGAARRADLVRRGDLGGRRRAARRRRLGLACTWPTPPT